MWPRNTKAARAAEEATMRVLTLCISCADLLRRGYRLERTEQQPGNGKCDNCRKKRYVSGYEVEKK